MASGNLSLRLTECPADASLNQLEALTQEVEAIASPDVDLCNGIVNLGSRLLMNPDYHHIAERLFLSVIQKPITDPVQSKGYTEVAIHLITLYTFSQKYEQAIALSTQFAAGAKNLYTAVYGRSLLLNCLADAGGYWAQRDKRSKQVLECIRTMEQEGDRFTITEAGRLILACFRLYSEMDGVEIRESIESIGRMAV